ncbi:MAG TPA: dihydrofolate reductase family protein [Ignavibacteria bacterium]|nr:dihydrofolate reductase family protein [Ignavibacteria bacterium]
MKVKLRIFEMSRQLILNIAMSLDGYIAGENDDLDFLKIVEKEGEDYGHSEFLQTIDTIIWGRRTYDKVLSFGIEFPYRDKNCFVFSKTKIGEDENVKFINEDINTFIEKLKHEKGKNIYCDGGGEIVLELMKNKLIDKFIISIIPCILGKGIKLFNESGQMQKLRLVKTCNFSTGLVQIEYDTIKN